MKLVRAYAYTDETGKLLYQNCRYEPKRFRQRRPNPNGDGWLWNLDGTRRVLYRLPELLRADPADPVFVVEGEKDADALAALGLVTTTAGAVTSWRGEFANFLDDRQVVVVPDNDEAGRKLATRIVKDLNAVGCTKKPRVLHLPGLPAGGDVSDWLAGGGTKAEILRLATRAEKPGTATVCLTKAVDIESRTMTWLWPGRIPSNCLTLLIGDPGVGKSYLTSYIIGRITTGRHWPDLPDTPAQRGSVLLCAHEDCSSTVIKPRLEAHGADLSRVDLITHIQDGRDRPTFDLGKHLTGFIDAVQSVEDCRAVILDPLTAYLGDINANSNSEVRRVLTPVCEAAARLQVSIIGINHLNKRPDLGFLHRQLGSVGFVGQSRSVWAVLKHLADPDARVLLPVKANYTNGNVAGLVYRIHDNQVVFNGEPYQGSIEDFTNNGRRTNLATEAADWLTKRLKGGPVEVGALFKEGEKQGYSSRTLHRAKAKANIEASRTGFGGPWIWRLSDPNETPIEDNTDETPF